MSARALALAAALFALACGPKIVRETIVARDDLRVELRRTEQGGQTIARGYAHPATIADVRIAHVLQSLTFERDDERRPLIRTQHVYPLAEGLSKALAVAGPDDEIAAATISVDRKLGIFSDERVTAFRLAVVGERMELHFFSIEDTLEKDGTKQSPAEYKLPLVVPAAKANFELVVGTAQERLGTRGLAVSWRDDYYRKPRNLAVRGGQVKRRTVLMELDEEKDAKPGALPPLPAGLSDAQRSALDQLEAQRSAGLVTEAEFRRRRQAILDGTAPTP